jgi:integrase
MGKRRGNREGSIYQDGDGRWRAVMDCGFRNGKRLRKKLSGHTRSEVAEKLKKLLHDQQSGLPPVGEKQSLGQFLVRWLEEKVKPKLTFKTYVSYSQQIRVHILPELGHLPLNKLSAQRLDLYINDKLRSGLSAKTVHYQHAIMRSALSQALRWDEVHRNVAKLVQAPKVPQFPVNPYTPAEAKAFLQALLGDRWEAMYTVAVACGLRQGETLGLRWADIDLISGAMHVRVQLQRAESRKLILVDLKTEASRRDIELPQVCIDSLKAHQARQARERALAGSRWTETGLVFTTSVGTGIDQRNLLRHFEATRKTATLRRIRYHDLRHTAASLLLALGVPIHVVQKILGHTDIRTTMNIYGHLYDAEKKDAANRMDTLLLPVAPSVAPNSQALPIN